MDKEFVRRVLGDEVAERVKILPDGGFTVALTENQIKLLETKYAKEGKAIFIKAYTATLPAKDYGEARPRHSN